MFSKKAPTNPKLLEAIDSALTDLQGFTAETEEFAAATARLTELYAMKAQEDPATSEALNPNTVALIAGNLLATLVVVEFERVGVVASKAKDFWAKFN